MRDKRIPGLGPNLILTSYALSSRVALDSEDKRCGPHGLTPAMRRLHLISSAKSQSDPKSQLLILGFGDSSNYKTKLLQVRLVALDSYLVPESTPKITPKFPARFPGQRL